MRVFEPVVEIFILVVSLCGILGERRNCIIPDDPDCFRCTAGNIVRNGCPTCQCIPIFDGIDIQFGNVLLTSDQARMLEEKTSTDVQVQARGIADVSVLLWNNLPQSNAMYRVPYMFDKELLTDNSTNKQADMIQRAVVALYSQTCVWFDPAKPGDSSIIKFRNGSGCSTFIGRKANQTRTIHGCLSDIGQVLSAMMNALGFWSETLRSDRDSYVHILKDSAPPYKRRYFNKLTNGTWESYDVQYDKASVTCLSPYEYSAAGGPTVLDKATGLPVFHNKWALSNGDKMQIRSMFNCSGRGIPKTKNCYYLQDYGLSYKGKVSVTESGLTCQYWNDTSTHSHKITPKTLSGSDLEMNYCRNPGMRDRPWCFTTNLNVTWEYCNITICNTLTELLARPLPLPVKRGFWSHWRPYGPCSQPCGPGYMYSTRRCVGDVPGSAACPGKYWRHLNCTLQRDCPESDVWSDWLPYSSCDVPCGTGNKTRVRFCLGTLGEGNCTGATTQNETCDTGITCPLYRGGECLNETSKGTDYRGTINVDNKNRSCLYWFNNTVLNIAQYPNDGLDKNYCRNPVGKQLIGPHCYFKQWKRSRCTIPRCNPAAVWGKWTRWSSCSLSDGVGILTRTRNCVNGGYGEGQCTGSVISVTTCNKTYTDEAYREQPQMPITEPPLATDPPSAQECVDYRDPQSYRGTRRWSTSGYTCQYWDSNYPHKHNFTDDKFIAKHGLSENFCRMPDDRTFSIPWCFIAEVNVEKEECDIPYCPYPDDQYSYFGNFFNSFWQEFSGLLLWNQSQLQKLFLKILGGDFSLF